MWGGLKLCGGGQCIMWGLGICGRWFFLGGGSLDICGLGVQGFMGLQALWRGSEL